jgi:hypothetical protein
MAKRETPPSLNQRSWNIINQLGFTKIEDFILFINKNGGIPIVKGCGEKTYEELRLRVEYYNRINNINSFTRTIPCIAKYPLNFNPDKPFLSKKSIKKEKPIFSKKNEKDNSLLIDLSNKLKPFKTIQLSILLNINEREKFIFNSASHYIFRNEKKSLRSIGDDINLSGERVRQLKIKIEKKVKNQTKELIENNPTLFNDSVYFEKNWSSYFIINNEITSSLNEIEGTTFSQYFLSFIFHLIFKNHIIFSISNNSNIFIHERCFKYPNLKKIVSRVIKGEGYSKYIEYEDNTIERLIMAISNELAHG